MTDSAAVSSTIIALTADIVSAHVAHNSIAVSELAKLIASVHASLSGLSDPPQAMADVQQPAVPIRTSVKPDYIVCLEDGLKLKMLKRHLMTRYQMTPADYRAKWGLPADYPMVAPEYAETRRRLAHKIGLGHKPRTSEEAPRPATDDEAAPTSKPGGRSRKAPAARTV